MHEISLADNILALVERSAAESGFERVRVLRLSVGQLAQVELHALRFALEALAPGTVLEGASLELDEPPGQAWCADCQQTVAYPERGPACPLCGGYALRVTGGTELRVVELLVVDQPG